MKEEQKIYRLLGLLLLLLSFATLGAPQFAQAGIYNADTEVTYKEYWIPHSQFTGGCGDHAKTNSWYVEPWGCTKTMTFNLPDDFSQALKIEIYIDLWRNYDTPSARFRLNNGPTRTPNVGSTWSRTPYIAEIPKSELQQGSNTITIWKEGGAYHIHDIAFRIYHDAEHPLLPGPGSDVTPPTGSLTGISAGGNSFAPGDGGVLSVDDNRLTFTADANGAAYVEFHGYYNGYDEDNDGQMLDWHNLNRNNWNPGGTEAKPTGGTINHIGTDATAPYEVTWDLSHVPNQTGVKFKIRLVDAAGNVREAAGGASAPFTLNRSYRVEAFRIPNFTDFGLHMDGKKPDTVVYNINLPSDLSGLTAAYMLGNYWRNPAISLNDQPAFRPFTTSQDSWLLSNVRLNLSHLRAGSNKIQYSYTGGFGHFIEEPGPLFVLHWNSGGTVPPPPPPPPPGDATVTYISSTSNGNAKGLKFADEDIIKYDPATNGWTMLFDGSDVNITTDINGFTFLENGDLLLTFNIETPVNALGTVDDSDIVRFTPTSLGQNTAGSFTLYLDGSTVGLTTNGEDIDAIAFAPDGRLLISTLGSHNVPGAGKGGDEDILALQGSVWSRYWDGSVMDFTETAEDIGGVWVADDGKLYLTTAGAFSVPGLTGSGDDIFTCTPAGGEPIQSCTFASFWDGATYGVGSEVIDDLFIGEAPSATVLAATAGDDLPDLLINVPLAPDASEAQPLTDPADANFDETAGADADDDVNPADEETETDEEQDHHLYLPFVGGR